MRRSPWLIVGLLVAPLLATIFLQFRKASELSRTNDLLRNTAAAHSAEVAALRSELDEMKRRNEVFRGESASLRRQLAGGSPSAPAQSGDDADAAESSAGEKPPESSGPADFMKSMARMYSDPEMRKVMRTQQTMGIQMMYGDLARELDLSPTDAARVMELLADRQMALASSGMAVFAGGDAKSLEETGKAADATRKEHDAQIGSLLGEEKMKRLGEYERTLGERLQLQQFETNFASSGQALKDEQRAGLLKIMQEERLKAPQSVFDPGNKDATQQLQAMQSTEAMEQVIATQRELNQRVFARARAVLSPDQMNILETAQKQQLDMQQMGVTLGKQFMKSREK